MLQWLSQGQLFSGARKAAAARRIQSVARAWAARPVRGRGAPSAHAARALASCARAGGRQEGKAGARGEGRAPRRGRARQQVVARLPAGRRLRRGRRRAPQSDEEKPQK